ncbi:tetratricopeptide repeat protein [Bacteroidota bacterium]
MAKKSGQKKKSQNKKGSDIKRTDADVKSEENKSVKSKKEKLEFTWKNSKFRAAIPFALAFLVYALIWIVKPGEPVVDPWFKAIKLVDSSKRVDDPVQRTKLMNEGGNELRRLVELHPYHARVRFFLGYYYFVKQDWDSSLFELKEAARLDSGSTINSIWPNAHELIIKAAINKSLLFRNTGNLQRAKDILLDASPYHPNNPMLNKHIGSVYFDMKEYDNAQRHFMISFNGNPKDADIANLIGVIYKMRGDVNNASAYFRRALQLNPNHAGAKVNLESLGI